jgi:2-methylcitrate dehydratase
MAPLQTAAQTIPMPTEHKGYDPEITDIANYVHNYPIDSDLAVSCDIL